MANTLSKNNITTGQPVEALQVSQSVDAFTGNQAYDITVSGSLTLTGSLYLQKNSILATGQDYVLTYNNTTGQVFKALTSSLVDPKDDGFEVYKTGSSSNNIIPANFGNNTGGGTNTAILSGCNNNLSGATNTSILGGRNNCITSAGNCSVIGGGCNNCIEAGTSFIGGGSSNHMDTNQSTLGGIISGVSNCITNTKNIIGGGNDNTISGKCSFIASGDLNTINANSCRSAIISGTQNTINSHTSFIGAGCLNSIDCGSTSAIVGGCNNTISSSFAFIGGGNTNQISGSSNFSGILSGRLNILKGENSSIVGGRDNCVGNDCSVILSGCGHRIASRNAAILSGRLNCIDASSCCSLIGAGRANQITSSINSSISSGCSNIIIGSVCAFIGAGNNNKISGSSRSSIATGGTNSISGSDLSFIGGGLCNIISGSDVSIIGSGDSNEINVSTRSFIGGGCGNIISSSICSFIGAGFNNELRGSDRSFIGSGVNNSITNGNCSGILGGSDNTLNHDRSFIVGSNLTSNKACYAFMNNLDVAGTISGSIFSGSFVGDGSGLTDLNIDSGSWDGIFTGDAQITGSLEVTGSVGATNFTGSSFTGSFIGDGSGLTNINTGSFTGSFTGSLTGSFIGDGSGLTNVNIGSQVYQTGSRICTIIPTKFGNNTNNGVNASISSGCNNNISVSYDSAIVSGCNNSITTRNTSTIGGGSTNCIDAACSFIGGGIQNNILGLVSNKSGIVSGDSNDIINSQNSFIGAGASNNITSSNNQSKFSSIVGGLNNTINNAFSFIGGGCKNLSNGCYASIVGGLENTSSAGCSFIGGGKHNKINSGNYSTIGSGCNNVISQGCSAILGGRDNTLEHSNSFILGSCITSHAACTTHVNNLTISASNNSSNAILKAVDLPAEQTPYYLSYNETTGQISKQSTSSISTGGGGLTIAEVTDIAESVSSNYNYGANVQNFLAKAREFNSGRIYSKPPKTIVLGDSILTNGTGIEKSYAHYLREHFSSSLLLPTSSFEIHAFGGKSYETFIPFIEDIMVNNNPDLVILAEYEYPSFQQGLSKADNYLIVNDFVIKMIQKHTTADIAISTWSLNETTAKIAYSGSVGEGGVGINDYKSEAKYLQINYLRDLARKYNCELIDVNQAGIDQIQSTQTYPDLASLATWPHCYPLYSTAFTSESIKHFVDNAWTQNLNLVNPNYDKEELITLKMGLTMDKFSENNISSSGTLSGIPQYQPSDGSYQVRNESTLYVDLTSSIGFELYWKDSSYSATLADKELFFLRLSNDGGGSYQKPSSLKFNDYPLEYATSIRALPFTDDEVQWASKRPMKKAEVLSSLSGSILSVGTGSSAQYKIEIRETGSIYGVSGLNTIKLSGSYKSYFDTMSQFKITGSTDNDRTYTIDGVSYPGTPDVTTVTTVESLTSNTVDGIVLTKSTGSGTVSDFTLNQDDFPLVLCDIKDPSSSTLASFVTGYETASIYDDKVRFPLGYNGEPNYTLKPSTYDPSDPSSSEPTPGDEYGFYFVSNWVDSIIPIATQSIDTLPSNLPHVDVNPLYGGNTLLSLSSMVKYPTINLRTSTSSDNDDKIYLRVFGYEKSNWKLEISANPIYDGNVPKLRVLGVNNIKSKNL